MVEVSKFFRVTTQLEVGGVVAEEYGRGLLLTTQDDISAGGDERVQYFTDIESVKEVFATPNSPVVDAAEKWFSYAVVALQNGIGYSLQARES